MDAHKAVLDLLLEEAGTGAAVTVKVAVVLAEDHAGIPGLRRMVIPAVNTVIIAGVSFIRPGMVE